jgi:hypothetical protein
MKLLLENWNKYLLSEGVSPAIDKFRRCWDEQKRKIEEKHAQDVAKAAAADDFDFVVPTPLNLTLLRQMNAYGGAGVVCLKGFEGLGSGAFRKVFAVPDNPNIVLKVVGSVQGAVQSNKEEAEFGRDPKFVEFVPKVYDVSDDYHWITAQKVVPFTKTDRGAGEEVMMETFPEFIKTSPRWYVPAAFDWDLWQNILIELSAGIKSGEVSFSPLKGRSGEEAEYALPFGIENPKARWRWDRPQDVDVLLKSLKTPSNIIHRFVNFIIEKNLTVYDFERRNLGYVEEEGRKRFVVLDPVVRH